MKSKLKISNINIGGTKSDEQLIEIKDIMSFYESQKGVINFFRDCYKMIMIYTMPNMKKDSEYLLLNKCFQDYQ